MYKAGEADATTTADLLQAAAAQLQTMAQVAVHHIVLDIEDDIRRQEIALTVYLDDL